MTISESLLPEFDQEMANTRKILERVPEGVLDWQPHEKSATMGWLATHLARIPVWVNYTLTTESVDVASPELAAERPLPAASTQALLELFDGCAAAAGLALAGAGDDAMRAPWSLLSHGTLIFTLPRVAVLRTMVLSHIIHDRAQLGVYLRLQGVPLPPMYGPTADEPM